MSLMTAPSRAAERLENLPFVEATLTYLAPMAEKPFTYTYDPPPGMPRTNQVYDEHKLPIFSARPLAPSLSLDREGFSLVKKPSAVKDFYDEAELRQVYYPEVQQIVAEATGAARVIVFDHTIRRRLPEVEDRTAGAPRQPVNRAHNDYTLRSGPQRVRDLMGDEAEALLGRRFAFINLWRPIRGPLLDHPLAYCDARTVKLEDFVASDLIYPDRRGETYAVRYSPRHRWFYVPAMGEDEAALIKCYDSETSGVARFVPHSAFADPTTPPDAPPRESIEIRTIAFYG
jgi:hypothetical protein